jgi:shikimate kinase
MGVGKTTIGKLLAKELDLEFIDSDQEIEHRAGTNIAWIFDVEGEGQFRVRESAVIEDLTQRSKVLIATGGGSILRPENRKNLVSRGVVVFLDTSLELQIKRTEKDKKRPLLRSDDPASVLRKLKGERQSLYEEVADITVFVGQDSSKQVVNSIVRQLKSSALLKK